MTRDYTRKRNTHNNSLMGAVGNKARFNTTAATTVHSSAKSTQQPNFTKAGLTLFGHLSDQKSLDNERPFINDLATAETIKQNNQQPNNSRVDEIFPGDSMEFRKNLMINKSSTRISSPGASGSEKCRATKEITSKNGSETSENYTMKDTTISNLPPSSDPALLLIEQLFFDYKNGILTKDPEEENKTLNMRPNSTQMDTTENILNSKPNKSSINSNPDAKMECKSIHDIPTPPMHSIDELDSSELCKRGDVSSDDIFSSTHLSISGNSWRNQFIVDFNHRMINKSRSSHFLSLLDEEVIFLTINNKRIDHSAHISSNETVSTISTLINTKVEFNVDSTAEAFYKSTTWLSHNEIIPGSVSETMMLRFFEYGKKKQNRITEDEVIEAYHSLGIETKTGFDRMLLKICKYLDPERYVEYIKEIPPVEILNRGIASINTVNDSNTDSNNADSNITTTLADDLREKLIGSFQSKITEMLPLPLINFISKMEKYFTTMVQISSLVKTQEDIDLIKENNTNNKIIDPENTNRSLSMSNLRNQLLTTGRDYIKTIEGRENCMVELQGLLSDIATTPMGKGNSPIAHKIKKKVESLVASLYKRE